MTTTAAIAADQILFTDNAANKVKELITEESNPNLKLRISVSGGGCSGFQYGFSFDENVVDGDTRVERNGWSWGMFPDFQEQRHDTFTPTHAGCHG